MTATKFYLRLAFSAITWLAYLLLIWLLPAFLGLFVVPIVYNCGMLRPIRSTVLDDKPMIWNPPQRWLWLWSNQEDGWQPDKFVKEHINDWSLFRIVFVWAALRNNVDSLRFVTWLMPPQRADLVQWETLGRITLVWQGWRARMIYRGDVKTIWLGWKYYAEKKDAEGWSRYGCGFTAKILSNTDTDA